MIAESEKKIIFIYCTLSVAVASFRAYGLQQTRQYYWYDVLCVATEFSMRGVLGFVEKRATDGSNRATMTNQQTANENQNCRTLWQNPK